MADPADPFEQFRLKAEAKKKAEAEAAAKEKAEADARAAAMADARAAADASGQAGPPPGFSSHRFDFGKPKPGDAAARPVEKLPIKGFTRDRNESLKPASEVKAERPKGWQTVRLVKTKPKPPA